jgi:hypothetical protein
LLPLKSGNYLLLAFILITGFMVVKIAYGGNRIDKVFLIGTSFIIVTAIANLFYDLYFGGDNYSTTFFKLGMIA